MGESTRYIYYQHEIIHPHMSTCLQRVAVLKRSLWWAVVCHTVQQHVSHRGAVCPTWASLQRHTIWDSGSSNLFSLKDEHWVKRLDGCVCSWVFVFFFYCVLLLSAALLITKSFIALCFGWWRVLFYCVKHFVLHFVCIKSALKNELWLIDLQDQSAHKNLNGQA